MNIARSLEHSARLFGNRVALIFEGTQLSYVELEEYAARLAAALRRRGIGRGDRVALFLPNIPAFAIAYYAIQKLGSIAVSINAGSAASEVSFILDDCAARAVFTTAELRLQIPDADLPELEHVVLCEGRISGETDLESLLSEAAGGLRGVDADRDEPAAILYTSGTTGTPKGATLSHGNVISNVWSFVHNCGMRPDDRILIPLPLFHCFGQNALLNSGLAAGSTLMLQRTFRPDTALQAVQDQKISMFFGVPTMFIALLDRATTEQMRSVRYYFSAAAKLPEEIERRWFDKFGSPVTQGYGLTETSPFASYNSFLQYRPGTIGTPIENVEMRVLDVNTSEEVPTNELGELVIRGPNVMLGYWNNPEETSLVLRDSWFRSGDIGRVDADGYFYIVDRLKDVIDVGGMNVYSSQVESVLYQQGDVAEVAVFGMPDELMGERVCAHVVLKSGALATTEQLLSFCRDRLADFKVPRSLELVEQLPRNPAGKVLKRVLRENTASQQGERPSNVGSAFSEVPAEGRRRLLVDLLIGELSAILDLPAGSIDPDELLTDLGLESLMAVDLVSRLNSRMGAELSSIRLINGGTINRLADELETVLSATTLRPDHLTGVSQRL
jgi:long-chain acyl-CoA synthetase